MGPSLGVNRMWTMKNDHAPKNGGADFFNICPKKAIKFAKKIDHSFAFTCLHWAIIDNGHRKGKKTTKTKNKKQINY